MSSRPLPNSIDYLKAIGIVLVVIGHCTVRDFALLIYTFHMPLFFWLSGYLFSRRLAFAEFVRSKLHRLMLPYALTMAVLYPLQEWHSSPERYRQFSDYLQSAGEMLQGGHMVSGWVGVHWFVTTLFLSQILLYGLSYLPKLAQWAAALLFYGFALYLDRDHPGLFLIFSVNSLPGALCFVLLGLLSKKRLESVKIWALALCTLLVVAQCIAVLRGMSFAFDLRNHQVGVPLISLVLACAWIYLLYGLCGFLARKAPLAGLVRVLSQRSMELMYLHMPLAVFLADYIPNVHVRLAVVLVLSGLLLALYEWIQRRRVPSPNSASVRD